MAELCTECLKKYGEEVSKVHPPVSSDKIQCCGDPSDCADFISGNCSGSVDKS